MRGHGLQHNAHNLDNAWYNAWYRRTHVLDQEGSDFEYGVNCMFRWWDAMICCTRVRFQTCRAFILNIPLSLAVKFAMRLMLGEEGRQCALGTSSQVGADGH